MIMILKIVLHLWSGMSRGLSALENERMNEWMSDWVKERLNEWIKIKIKTKIITRNGYNMIM